MLSDELKDLVGQHRTEQQKYVYFQLAIAASAIAFTVRMTSKMTASWPMAYLGLAVSFWGLSFYLGCLNRMWNQMTLCANFSLLLLKEGMHPEQPNEPRVLQAVIADIKGATESNSSRAGRYGRWQFRFLIWGGIAFLLWHITELIDRTISI